MKTLKTLILASSVAALAASPAVALQAAGQATQPSQQPPTQQQPAQQPGYMQQPAPANYSDEQLRNFVRAAQRVNEILVEYQPEAEAAESQEEFAVLQQEVQAEMTAAVDEEGLTAEEFNQINAAAQQNPQLAERITVIAQEEQSGQGR